MKQTERSRRKKNWNGTNESVSEESARSRSLKWRVEYTSSKRVQLQLSLSFVIRSSHKTDGNEFSLLNETKWEMRASEDLSSPSKLLLRIEVVFTCKRERLTMPRASGVGTVIENGSTGGRVDDTYRWTFDLNSPVWAMSERLFHFSPTKPFSDCCFGVADDFASP